MEAIHKYIVTPTQDYVELPVGAKVMSVESQDLDIVLYALVDTETKSRYRLPIKVYGTGHEIKDTKELYRYIGTVKMRDGMLMFHIFVADITEGYSRVT